MENVLDVYKRPCFMPVVCMKESPRQLMGKVKILYLQYLTDWKIFTMNIKVKGVCNVFMVCESLAGKRIVKITECREIPDWAHFIEDIASSYGETKKIMLVMDNLNTHEPELPYKTFPPVKAKALWDRFEFFYTPKHVNWLNMTEIELNVLASQCLEGLKILTQL